MDLDLKELLNLVIHSWLKSGKARELESQKGRESQGTLLKKLSGNPEEVSHSRKSFFAKSKLTNLKNSRGNLHGTVYFSEF